MIISNLLDYSLEKTSCMTCYLQQLTLLTEWHQHCGHFCICAARLSQKAGGTFCSSPGPYSGQMTYS